MQSSFKLPSILKPLKDSSSVFVLDADGGCTLSESGVSKGTVYRFVPFGYKLTLEALGSDSIECGGVTSKSVVLTGSSEVLAIAKPGGYLVTGNPVHAPEAGDNVAPVKRRAASKPNSGKAPSKAKKEL